MGSEKVGSSSVIKLMKVLLYSVVVLFLIGGSLLLGLGIWIRVDGNSYFTVFGKGGPEIPSVIMIAVGGAVILISILGCLGGLLESRVLLVTFITILCLIVAGQIIVISLSILYKDELEDKVTEALNENIQIYYGTNHTDIRESIDKIQSELECCGAKNYTDWKTSNYGEINGPFFLPQSCCKPGAAADCARGIDQTKFYTANCVKELDNWANTKLIIIISVGIAVAIFEVLGILFGLMVLRFV